MAEAGITAEHTAYERVVAKAWKNPAFKATLLADPVAALAAAGVAVPPGLTVKVVEDTEKLVHFVLPPRPAEGELSDEALEKVAGGRGINKGIVVVNLSGHDSPFTAPGHKE